MFLRFPIFILLVLATAMSAQAQVRVGGNRHKHSDRKSRHHKSKDDKQAQAVKVHIVASDASWTKNLLKDHFYQVWQPNHLLQYADFGKNAAVYNRFFPAEDSDLLHVEYDSYISFYKKLAERAENSNDSFWQQKVQKALQAQLDSSVAGYPVSPPADNGTYISIDSPAVSSIGIVPVIYPQNDDSYYYSIPATFQKRESWIIVKSPDILDHEQIHFDIFEMYARKMRKCLADELKKNHNAEETANLSMLIGNAYERLYEELTQLQLVFDQETSLLTAENSPITELNKKWHARISNELQLLDAYSAPEGVISLER